MLFTCFRFILRGKFASKTNSEIVFFVVYWFISLEKCVTSSPRHSNSFLFLVVNDWGHQFFVERMFWVFGHLVPVWQGGYWYWNYWKILECTGKIFHTGIILEKPYFLEKKLKIWKIYWNYTVILIFWYFKILELFWLH